MGFDPSTTKPEIDFPGDSAPADLVIEDIKAGDGAEAKAGDTISAHYVGVAHSTGEEFDASWNRGAPLDFRVGVGQVIAGWDQGITGMRVGGRRRLVIPPQMAYGERGAPGAIAPNETLIFVVDLVAVR
jgi:peptidylprolyl isomerase